MKYDFNFYQNKDCRYYPCHKDVAEDEFNCLFCYCPLYFIDCEGDYKLLDNGMKDCMGCTKNHDKHSWKFVIKTLRGVHDEK